MDRPFCYALIPARGGSKGLPRKNVLPLAGVPLIVWTIKAAQDCPSIDAVYVTTDDAEIATVAREAGARIIERPAELAADTTPAAPVLAHALALWKGEGVLPTYVAYLQPTSPLRTGAHLTSAFAALENAGGDTVVSVTTGEKQWLKSFASDGAFMRPVAPEYTNMNRQSLPEVYEQNGALYILSTDTLTEEPRFFGERTVPFVMTAEESIDIDTAEDLARAEELLSRA